MLIVDDEPSILNSLNFIFRKQYNVTTATSAEEALELIEQQDYQVQLVISDQRMGGMYGHELLNKINENFPFSGSILCTGYSDMQDLVKAVNDGHIFSYISKPWDIADIQHQIRKAAEFYSLSIENIHLTESLKKENQELEKKVIQRTLELEDANKKLKKLAKYDVLTSLANRALFNEFLSKSLIISLRKGRKLAVLFIDLDNFKDINDTLGHDIGDRLLCSVATRLNQSVRECDIVSRFGGDEFAIVLEEIKEAKDAAQIAKKIITALAKPHFLGVAKHKVVISPSIGIAIYPECGLKADELIKAADTAMYHGKSLGKNNYQFYSYEMQEVVIKRLRMEQSLRNAIENNEIELHYQPQIDVLNEDIFGIEVLARWRSHEFGNISPTEFIPIAEESGLIVPLGEWILNAAITQGQAWHNDPTIKSSPIISVNISARQLENRSFLDTIKSLVDKGALEHVRLELELTESSLMKNPLQSIALLKDIFQLGINTSIDDFGTGYSSLKYLEKLPVNVLKIDQSFVFQIGKTSRGDAIVKAIIAMANSMELKVIAEGVEEKEQLDFLLKQNCNLMQGFYFSQPIPADQILTLLQSEQSILEALST